MIEVLNSVGRSFCTFAGAMFLQATVLVVILFLADGLLRKRVKATLRYWLWMLVFIKLLLPPSLSSPASLGYWYHGWAAKSPSTAPTVVSVPVETQNLASLPELPGMVPSEPPSPTPSELRLPPSSRHIDLAWPGITFVLWLVGVLVLSALLLQRVCFVRGLIAQSVPAEAPLLDLLSRCCDQMGIHRPVGLRLSPSTFSPAVCGLVRPVILLPASLLQKLSADDLRAVLIHELAHLKRGDLWLNSFQTLLQIAYFYNPFVWLAGVMSRRVREQAVDEMVLVALGAEARSYSRTLIDIAEMAFFRPTWTLRLIGVAESKKSLEGRIKHMLTMSVPKSAKLGIGGMLMLVATGMILLPMATAQIQKRQPLVGHLPNGAAVELVGVCNWPADEPLGWRPDGDALDRPLRVTKWNQRPGPHHYGFMLKVVGPNDLEVKWNSIEGSDGWEGSCDVVDAQGSRLPGYTAAVALVKEGTAHARLRVGVAAGLWSTTSSCDGKSMSRIVDKVLWSQAFQTESGASIVATAEWRKDRSERIVAIDTEGLVHTGVVGSVATDNMDQMTARFPGLALSRITEFQYQGRPYEWVRFENVSLQPGQKSEPAVQTGGAEESGLP
jgi:beta-lactamase regulating signal transducer with metallopeptidase domain